MAVPNTERLRLAARIATLVTMPVSIIAEIGTAHGGNPHKMRALIDAAADSGADYVKFQWVYADEILHPDTGFVSLPGGTVPLYQRFRELEVPPEFFSEALEYAHKCGVGFICSPFGLKSLGELLALKPDAVKIASPELNHYPLLKKLNEYAENMGDSAPPAILSAGVSRLGDIEKALGCLNAYQRLPQKDSRLAPLSLLHCVTAYPAPETEYNLRTIQTLSAIFGVSTGVSDHSLDAVLVPVLSVIAGGVIIEKHITLSKETDGLDDPVALEPREFALMTEQVRKAEQYLSAYGSACGADSALEALARSYPKETIIAALGDGVKRLAPAEAANYGRTNRSLHFMKHLQAGTCISKGDIAVLRTEKVLTPGISPEYLDTVLGARLARDVRSGDGVQWRQLLLY